MKIVAGILAVGLAATGWADQAVYDGQLENGWQNWSWATVNFQNASPTYSDKYSISITETGSYQAIYLHNNAQATWGFECLRFWVNGGTGGQTGLSVQATINGGAQIVYPLPALPKNQWVEVEVPLVGLGVGSVNDFDGFWIIDDSGQTQAEYYLDAISLVSRPASVPSQPIYDGALENQWTNTSTAIANFSNTTPVYAGGHSISVASAKASDVFAVSHPSIDATIYRTLTFWINGGAQGGQSLRVAALAGGTAQTPVTLPTLAKNTWTSITIPLPNLGVGVRGDLDGFVISNAAVSVPATYYLDAFTLSSVPIVNPLATISVSTASSTPISPFIYGVNSTDWVDLGTGFGFSRMGGNRLEAYNWENNASNAGSDYIFENDGFMGATNQAGWTNTNFIAAALAGNAMPLLTLQMMGLVSADKGPGGNVNQTPDYINVRFKKVKAAKPSGAYVYPPNVEDDYVYMDEFVHYIKQFASPNYPLMFDLDNEPDLWDSTFSEIHPNPSTYAEELNDSVATSTAVKRVYPQALIFGPVSYGWLGYRTFQNAPDANGRDFLSFYLAGMSMASKTAGKRLLDVLDLHWYPEATGDGVRIVNDGDSPGLAAARMQASRSLFDNTYVENSWITGSLGNKPIDLLPGTLSIINTNYPGTKLSISEYNYGGPNTISGAIAQADVLGIFGRYGLFAAANWGIGAGCAAELAGFQAFINYDRAGSRFGNLELPVTGETPANNAVYAALDSTNSKRMTLVIINKTIGTSPFTINLTGFAVNSAAAYTIVAPNYAAPASTPVTNLTDSISITVPPQSITTVQLLSK